MPTAQVHSAAIGPGLVGIQSQGGPRVWAAINLELSPKQEKSLDVESRRDKADGWMDGDGGEMNGTL